MDAGLVEAGKQAIEVLLKLKGEDIVLIPEKGTSTETPSGGIDYEEASPLPVQRFSLRKATEDDGLFEAESGIQAQSFTYIMTGRHDCDVPIPCYWEDGGNRYRVEREFIKNEYSRKFVVQTQGSEPRYG